MTGAFWSSPHATLVGEGELGRIEPGSGPERYRRASEALARSSRGMGFASFTFDPYRDGSVVLSPESVRSNWAPEHGDLPRGTVTEDGRSDWESGFAEARSALASGQVEKVVLARRVMVEFEDLVPVNRLLARLTALNPSTYVFAVDGLVGASPELLIRVSAGRVESLVLAGTAPDPSRLVGDKLSREHELAAVAVEAALRPLTLDLHSEQAPIVFGGISHLATRFDGLARSGLGVLDFVAALHPTPAVCGTPTGAALQLIRRIEPGPRGRYAGPIGWFDLMGDGEFALALRCGLVAGRQVTLHAGGGLVAESVEESEWEETGLKLGPMLRSLGIDPPQS
jgi:menaquinone-specific isochorismate synthase